MFVVRGENVYPSAIEDVVRGIGGLSDEYRIIITREGIMDELAVQAERAEGVGGDSVPQLKKKLEAELKTRGLRSVVEILNPGTLERTQFKAKRVIDKRHLYEGPVK
jgi:phenylacetate-CoA ligase